MYDTLAMREIACPGGEPPVMPTARALPALPDDADARFTEVLTSADGGRDGMHHPAAQ